MPRKDSPLVLSDLESVAGKSGALILGSENKIRWHAQPAAAVLAALETGLDGLNAQEAESRKKRFGLNRLAAAPKRSEILRFLSQFNNVLIYVLLAAAGLALAIGHIADSSVVLAVVLVNAAIGYVQEGRAEKALDAIRGMIDPRAMVIRDGRRSTIAAESIVPGDLVLLEPGDRVPADLRLIRVRNLRIDEAALTGESVPVDKTVEANSAEAPLGDRTSMTFSGTFVASGNGMGIAVATGTASQLGRISTLVGAIETLTTPLVRQMNDLARRLTVIILVASLAVFAFAVLVRGYHWQEAFMVMIGLAVAAIPEGLPAVMTITLAIGVQRMAARNAIIRRLPAVETLGSVSVICSDKTGTLTRNEMTVRTVLTTEGQFDISGAGYRPEGEFELNGRLVEPASYPILIEAAKASILCNDAELRARDGTWVVNGDPMEGALVSFGVKAGYDASLLRKQLPRTDEIPFDRALLLVVTAKYVLILLRVDNRGEGGTLSLMALAQRVLGSERSRLAILMLGIAAAALFYGDALITPAISVLSAVEGLEVAAPNLASFVMPITAVILIALFAVQSRGTERVAGYFGPVMTVWFLTLGVVGIGHIADDPGILHAFNPVYAAGFLASHGHIGLVTLGAVFLAVTGTEALYADLGHFGRKPIQIAWCFLVLPCLAINYLGQGALVLANPNTVANPFYHLVPDWALYPMIGLATVATIIASQAVITGAFSLTNQAVQLGLLPRMQIRRTSETQAGQIYVPRIRGLLLVGVLLLVVMFRSSSGLASAYGLAVNGTMLVDGLMASLVIWKVWRWAPLATAALMIPIVFIDLTFLSANLLKVPEGGWVPVLIGSTLVLIMLTWLKGARILAKKATRLEMPMDELIANLAKSPPTTVPGTAVFLTGDPSGAPTALLHSLKHYKVLHENNVILTVATEGIPRVAQEDRVKLERMSDRFMSMVLHFGFMERPNVPRALAIARKLGWSFDIMSTSFFLSRRSVRPDPKSGMPGWQDRLFIFLAQNADDASSYFQLPTDRVVEIGTQVTV